jgi:hypothetical protein
MLITKFDKTKKMNYLVCQTGVSNFDSFIAKPRNELNLRI